jgi:hypothetical protein
MHKERLNEIAQETHNEDANEDSMEDDFAASGFAYDGVPGV